MWLNAPPASGKSILATYVIDYVRDAGHECQYFYFRFGDQTKRSTSALLKSLGLQLAKQNLAFRQILTKLSGEGVRLAKKDARIIWQKLFVSGFSQMTLTKPLYWVVDALDESESPKMLLDLLQSLSISRPPIRILVVSRTTEALSLAFERLSTYVPVDVIEITSQEHVSSDIKLYLKHEIKFMRGSEKFKEYVMQRILERASGNFLWVYLVLEEISSCHTQKSIEQTLKEIPPGMESFYQRMEAAIVQNPKQTDRTLARTLISWTMCAQRPLSLKELSQALAPEFPDLLNLKRTVREVCGQFLVVDQTSRVSLVHQSARDYLAKTPGLRISLSMKASHEEFLVKCISFLCSPRLHLKLVREPSSFPNTEPFLAYAATSWPYHLRQAHTESSDVLNFLVKFFEDVSVLSWIHSLALLRHLEALVQAAYALTSTVGMHRRSNAEKSILLHRLQDLELLDMWATDLLKVTGKFGKYLLQSPAVIYKKIPPFCPKSSVLYRQFYHENKAKVLVNGVSNALRDDCLARMTLPRGFRALTIKCAGRYIAVLSSIGTIFLWDSSSFEEICTLTHKEYVTVMCFNSESDRLVSYGVKTTKVWSIPSGELLNSLSNPTDARAMAISFAENGTKILIASDDRLLRHCYLSGDEGGWQSPNPALIEDSTQIDGGFLTAPSNMAFNPDATQIAVAYRGYPLSVWSTTEPRLVGRCRRATPTRSDYIRPSVSWMAVDRVVWNSITGHLIGLYKDGSIFKWHPSEKDTLEAHAIADEIEINPDGRLFVTSDSRGVVKIWNFPFLCVIYQLSSEDLVNGLAFSPDGGRFYDLRGSSINVWEPNILICLSESEETASETASEDRKLVSMSQASKSSVKPVDTICTLAVAPKSCLYCVANEDGVVTLFDRYKGKLLELNISQSFLTTDHLTWAKDGHHIASADMGGNINVKRLDSPKYIAASGEIKIHSVLATKVKPDFGGIHQILLSGASAKLLVLGHGTGQTWSLETGRIEATSTVENGKARKSINHPLYDDLIVSVGPGELKALRWEDLSEVYSFRFRTSWPRLHGRSSLDSQEAPDTSLAHLILDPSTVRNGAFVSKLIFTQDKEHLLIQTSEISTQGKITKGILILSTSCLEKPPGNEGSKRIDSFYISGSVLIKIEVPLGILPGNRLVFLDQDLWMCTFKLNSADPANGLKRHYFIPRDWASTEALDQCCMLDDGTLLLPKDGEVAVITSALADPEW